MKHTLIFFAIVCCCNFPDSFCQEDKKFVCNASKDLPKSAFNSNFSVAMDTFDFGGAWNDPVYLQANSAANETYLSEEEKKVFYYLNLVRLNPQLFLNTYLKEIKTSDGEYSKSLYRDLKKMKPVGILKPDTLLFLSSKCHAEETGKSGAIGHNRKKCKPHFTAECIAYGVPEALEIVLCLLIDQNVPSLGHRVTCLSKDYTKLGVSIQPHKNMRVNAVLDFE